jgi:hypothetical protein
MIKFRSITNLKGFNDFTYVKGESEVDPSQYVPLQKLLERVRRGDYSGVGSNPSYDDEELVNSDFVPPTRRPNFDLADFTEMIEKAKRIKNQLEKSQKKLTKSNDVNEVVISPAEKSAGSPGVQAGSKKILSGGE